MIRSIVAGLVAIVVLMLGLFIGADFALKSTMQVDLIGTIAHGVALAQPVDEGQVVTHPFDIEKDMVDVQDEVNASVENMITYSQENGYWVNFNNLPDDMKTIIELSDKQVGALAQTVIMQELAGQVQIKNLYMDIEVLQVEFARNDSSNVEVNTVVAIDTTAFKSIMPDVFPVTNIKNVIPDTLYVSSTNEVIKGEEAFEYTLNNVDFTINNLTEQQTASFFHTLDTVLGIGSAEYISTQIGSTLMGALVGGENARGLAYSLKDIGATDFEFVDKSSGIYFTVQR